MAKAVRKLKPATSNVTIFKMSEGWGLTIAVTVNRKSHYRTYTFNKLVEALTAASILKVHVNNLADLPIKQYREAA